MKITRIDLKLKINPNEPDMYGSAFLTVKNPSPKIELMINKQLQWLELYSEVKGKKYYFTPLEKDVAENHFLKSAKIWSIELPEEIQGLDEFHLSVRYSGQIESDPWSTNYISETGVELGLYVAYYPILNITDKISFSLILQAPKSWSWIMNSERLKDCQCDIWVSEEPKTDLYIIGIPTKEAISPEKFSRFWGLKRNYGRFSELDSYLEKFYYSLVEILGKPPLDSFKIVLVPREKGGMITRQGIIVMQDNIPEDVIIEKRDILILKWVHEMCHFWFNKTSVETYDNWIDEGLSDYISLFISKFTFSENFYSEQIQEIKNKISECEDLVPIKDITRQHDKADVLFYKYGSLIFHEINEIIGDEQFRLFLSNFAEESLRANQITTEDLIEALKGVYKNDWETFLNEKIEKKPSMEI